MAKTSNLIPQAHKLTLEEQSAGGKASVKARRERKTMREMLQMCLDMENSKGQTFQELATLGLIQGAIKGKALNYRTIVETLGELGPEASTSKENGILDELTEALRNAKND